MDQQNDASGVATAAKDQAGQVGQTAAEAGGQVAQTTKEQAQNVVGEARQQARDLVGEARAQVRDQAGTQKGRAVDGLRSLADELDQMGRQQDGQSGIVAEVARQAAQRAHGLADHLDRHEPAELLDQVRAYARRRPAVFLTGAAVLGVLAGRATRSLAAGSDSGPRQLTGGYPAGYGTAGTAGYPASIEPGYPGNGEPAYPIGGAEAAGYEPGFVPGAEPGGGYPATPGREAGYPATPGRETGYPAGSGYRPEAGDEDPAWRTP